MTDRTIIRHVEEKSASSSDALRPVIGSWKFIRTNKKPQGPDHWLWRTCEPYRLTASGICFSARR